MSVMVKDLAAEGHEGGKASQFPGVPAWLVVLSLVVVALGIVTLPLGLIISNSSEESLSDLSQLVTRQAVDGIYNQVQTNLNEPLQFLNILRNSTTVRKVVLSNFANLGNETALFSFFVSLINSTQYLSFIQCMTYPNLFAGNQTTTPGQLPNITELLVRRDPLNVYRRVFRDWSNSPMTTVMISLSLPDGSWGPAFMIPSPIFQYTIIFSTPSLTKVIALDIHTSTLKASVVDHNLISIIPNKTFPVEYQNTYTQGKLFTSAIGGVWDSSTSKDHISYACEVGFDSDGALSPLLESIKVTTNTHVFLIDSVSGILLANSVPGTCSTISNFSDPSLPTIAFTPDTTNDTNARDIGTYLKGKYGNYSLIPNLDQTVSMETTIGSIRWIINYRYLDTPNTYIVVVGIPRSDFFSKVDTAQQKALILACVLAAVGVIVTVVFAWFAMRPLHTLTLAMEKLTKMDFTALEDRSFMIEVRCLQVNFAFYLQSISAHLTPVNTFNTFYDKFRGTNVTLYRMCKAFASGIRRNKALVSNSPH
ncbi:hypothetical protein HDU76_003362 [Blyttiomyces sp. JEL0837]|nr:hypothetical protein HDU76_003362 [Blyttiomyces sp. JEL0837]